MFSKLLLPEHSFFSRTKLNQGQNPVLKKQENSDKQANAWIVVRLPACLGVLHRTEQLMKRTTVTTTCLSCLFATEEASSVSARVSDRVLVSER